MWVSEVGHERVVAMAAASTTDAVKVTQSDVYRTLLAEAVTARSRDCATAHRGPVAAGACCGHCGRPA